MWASALTAQKCLGSYHFFKTNWGQWYPRAIPEDFCFFSKIRQTKACEITLPFYQWRNLGSALCVFGLYVPLGSTPGPVQTPHITFSLRMLLVQVPWQRKHKSKNRELTQHLRHCQCPMSTQAAASIMNVFNLQWCMKDTKANSQKSSDSPRVERLLVIDYSHIFVMWSQLSIRETSLQIKAVT